MKCVANRETPRVTGEQALAALEVAQSILGKIEEHSRLVAQALGNAAKRFRNLRPSEASLRLAYPHATPCHVRSSGAEFTPRWREPSSPGGSCAMASDRSHPPPDPFFVALPDAHREPPAAPIDTGISTRPCTWSRPRFYEPTQKAPNKGKVTRELDVRSVRPVAATQAPRFRPPAPCRDHCLKRRRRWSLPHHRLQSPRLSLQDRRRRRPASDPFQTSTPAAAATSGKAQTCV